MLYVSFFNDLLLLQTDNGGGGGAGGGPTKPGVGFHHSLSSTGGHVSWSLDLSSSLTKQPFWSRKLTQEILKFASAFPIFRFRNVFSLQSKVASLASNPQPGGPCSCIYVSQ
jgi:hypothetical protein